MGGYIGIMEKKMETTKGTRYTSVLQSSYVSCLRERPEQRACNSLGWPSRDKRVATEVRFCDTPPCLCVFDGPLMTWSNLPKSATKCAKH